MRSHELDHADLVGALDVGARRELSARRTHRRDSAQYVAPAESLFRNVIGAGGELAVARVRAMDWPGFTERDVPDKRPDLAGLEVKTAARPYRDLAIRSAIWERGRYAPAYALVWGSLTARFDVVGCMSGDQVRREVADLDPDPNGVKYVPWWLLAGRHG